MNPPAFLYCMLPAFVVGPLMIGMSAQGDLESGKDIALFSIGFPVALTGILGGSMGCPASTIEAVVDLRLETSDGVFVGHGEASHRSGQVPNQDVWNAAVHDAFQQALHSAQRSAVRGPKRASIQREP